MNDDEAARAMDYALGWNEEADGVHPQKALFALSTIVERPR